MASSSSVDTSISTPFRESQYLTSIAPMETKTRPAPTLRDIILAEREKRGLSQEEFADRVGMSQEWTSKVEQGEIVRPKMKTLVRVSTFTGVDIVDLLIASGYVTTKAQSKRVANMLAEEIPDYDAEGLRTIRDMMSMVILATERLPQTKSRREAIAAIRAVLADMER